MPPAARVTDLHVCPAVTVLVPHVGGPILPPGAVTVLIGGLPAARMGDMAICVGPPSSIIIGSLKVLIGKKPAARMGDSTAHGGVITLGCPTVLIQLSRKGGQTDRPRQNRAGHLHDVGLTLRRYRLSSAIEHALYGNRRVHIPPARQWAVHRLFRIV